MSEECGSIPPLLEGDKGTTASGKNTAAIALAAIVALILLAPLAATTSWIWRCPLLQVTGIPCAFCGGTRAFIALGKFNIVQALQLNPLATVGAVGALLWAASLLFTGKQPPIDWQKPRPWIYLSLGFVVNWLYLIFYLPR